MCRQVTEEARLGPLHLAHTLQNATRKFAILRPAVGLTERALGSRTCMKMTIGLASTQLVFSCAILHLLSLAADPWS